MKRKIQILILILFAGFAAVFSFHKAPATEAANGSDKDTKSAAENHLPEIADLRHDRIGVGQRLTFGLEVIDEEGDFVRIELPEKPASAKFNQNTLTVDWTPTKADGESGRFLVRATEIPRDKTRKQRTVTKEYNIRIVREKVDLMALPVTSLEVDSLVSVIDPDRLAAANKKWDIVSLFQRIAEIEAEKQITPDNGIQPSNGKQFFREALKQLAVLHKNPTLDPDDQSFNQIWEAGNWKLIAVRPRINKKVFELRLVYFVPEAAEQAYLMFRMRIVRGDDADRPDAVRQKNNYLFAKKFHDTFFDGEKLRDFVARDKGRYGKALEEFITWVLTYRDPEDPMLRANFAALPHNSRLGGGNEYDANGNYLYGDGWALGAMLVKPVMRDGRNTLAVVSPPIAGFVASIKPAADGMKYATFAPPIVNPKSRGFRKGWDAIFDPSHKTVFIPEIMPDGKVGKSNIDTNINAHDYKFRYMVAETPLDDPRRRLFEEKGMTCIQCHVRNFDEGDYLTGVQKPKETPPNVSTRKIPRVFFVIVPTLHGGRSEYIHREEQEQVGNLKGVFRDYLGIDVKINSPLALEWVYDTKNGRS